MQTAKAVAAAVNYFVIMLLLCIYTRCETQAFVAGSVGIFDNLGYKNPSPMGSVGLDIRTTHFFAEFDARAAWERKIETADGYGYGADVAVYYGKRWLVGAGDRWSGETTSQWSKASHRPFLGMGYYAQDARIRIDYLTPWLDIQNRLQGPLATIEMGQGHWRLLLVDGLLWYRDTRVPGVSYASAPQWHLGAETAGGVKYVF